MKYYLAVVVALMAGVTCHAQKSIHVDEEVVIGGIRQYITIESSDTTLPLLLFLHGGPGGSVLSYASRFTDRLRENFIVVQWDQRETGRTLQLNPSPIPLSLKVFQDDTREMAELLLNRFHRQKLYVVGHSWGTALAFYLARQHPQLLYACVAIGPMIHQAESERMALDIMKQKAFVSGNTKALIELEAVRVPFENGEQLYYHRRWLQEYSGSRKSLPRTYVTQWADTWLDVFNEASSENLFNTMPSASCPLYIIAGKKDLQTNSQLAESYFKILQAPKKDFFWVNTGHSIPGARPQEMQAILIERIRPETLTQSPF